MKTMSRQQESRTCGTLGGSCVLSPPRCLHFVLVLHHHASAAAVHFQKRAWSPNSCYDARATHVLMILWLFALSFQGESGRRLPKQRSMAPHCKQDRFGGVGFGTTLTGALALILVWLICIAPPQGARSLRTHAPAPYLLVGSQKPLVHILCGTLPVLDKVACASLWGVPSDWGND